MTKMTYVNALDTAINFLNENIQYGDDFSATVEKLEALKVQLAKKSSGERKPTATQKENVGFKDVIAMTLEAEKNYTVTDIMKSVPEVANLSNQRVSALVRQLVADGILVREEIKRKAYFHLA